MKVKILKKVIIIFILSLISQNIFASEKSKYEELAKISNDTSGMPSLSTNSQILDLPLVGGITSFAMSLDYFTDIVLQLCVLASFLMIIFSSFKMWSSTVEIKKVFVDIIYKCLLCSLICFIYKPVTNSILKISTEIGTQCAGGFDKINAVYSESYKVLLSNIDKGIDEIKKSLVENAFKATDGNSYITEDTIQNLFSYGMSEAEIEAWAKENNINIAKPNMVIQNIYAGGYKVGEQEVQNGFLGVDGKPLQYKNWIGISKTLSESKMNKQLKKNINSKKQLQYVDKINALTKVLTGVNLDGDDSPESAQETEQNKKRSYTLLKNMSYSPYLKDSNGNNTFYLSPSKILHTCIIMSDALSYALSENIDEKTGEIKSVVLNPGNLWTFDGIIQGIGAIFFKFGMILATVILMGEYIITILEFYLVRALATLLIPLLFIDATKSYSQNLLKLALSYFMKIATVIVCCFFSFGLFMDITVFTYTDLDLKATQTLIAYISTIVTGLMIALNAPKIASAVMSGQPSMGIGDIARLGSNMAHAVHSAQHMAHAAGQFGQKAAHVGQNIAKGAAGGIQTLESIRAASFQTGKNLREARDSGTYKGSDADIRKAQTQAGFETFKQAVGQKFGDAAHKAAFGTERHHLDENGNTQGFWKVGQQVMVKGQQRAATAEDVKKHNNEIALKNAEKSSNKSLDANKNTFQNDIPLEEPEKKIPWPECNGH